MEVDGTDMIIELNCMFESQGSAKSNMKQAVLARNQFCDAISRCAASGSTNPSAVIEAAHQYLPFVVRIS